MGLLENRRKRFQKKEEKSLTPKNDMGTSPEFMNYGK